MDHGHAHLGVLDLRKLRDRRLDRADHVALEDEVQVLDGAFLQRLVQRLERDAAAALSQDLPAQPLPAQLREVPRLALVLDDARVLACRRRVVEAEDLDRISGPGLLELLAAEAVERAHLAPGVAGDDRVADLQRAAVHEHRRHRAASNVET